MVVMEMRKRVSDVCGTLSLSISRRCASGPWSMMITSSPTSIMYPEQARLTTARAYRTPKW